MTARDSDDATDETRQVLEALSDSTCLAILETTADDAMTATEVADAIDVPLSTVYRKVEDLTALGLLQETCRVNPGGRHPNQYHCAFDRLVVARTTGADDHFLTIERVTEDRADGPTDRIRND